MQTKCDSIQFCTLLIKKAVYEALIWEHFHHNITLDKLNFFLNVQDDQFEIIYTT